MPNFRVSTQPVSEMTKVELQKEARTLKPLLVRVYSDIAGKKAWAKADGKLQDSKYLEWMAKTATYRGRLECRSEEVKGQLLKLKE